MENKNYTTTDCRDEDGVTVGLIDAIISISRVLAGRDLESTTAKEALKDLADDECLATILQEAHNKSHQERSN